jgi:hypothetical protein
MSPRLRIVLTVALVAFAPAPAFSQSAPETSRNSPGAMATMDRAANQNRASCEREAKEQKLSFWKRRTFIKNCMKR